MHAEALSLAHVATAQPGFHPVRAARAWRKLEWAVASVLARLVEETCELQDRPFAALTPALVTGALVRCAEGATLNLRRLAGFARDGSYSDPSCGAALVLKRLPASAWRDLQDAGKRPFTEVILPDVMGADAALAGLRGLRALRTINMAMDRGTRTLDLRTLADFPQPLRVELRCSVATPIEVIAPANVTVTAELDDDLPTQTCVVQAACESGSAFFDRAVRIANEPGSRIRLSWREVRGGGSPFHPAVHSQSWLKRAMRLFRAPASIGISADAAHLARSECNTTLHRSLMSACQLTGTLVRDIDMQHQTDDVVARLCDSGLDLSASAAAPLVLAMPLGGWLALERCSRALFGSGIRTLRFPASLASLRYNGMFLAHLDELTDLCAVQFGDSMTTLRLRAA